MADLDLDAIQQRAELTYREDANNDVQRLLDEIGRLRAERYRLVAEVQRLRDRRSRHSVRRQQAEQDAARLRDGIRDIAVSLREFPCAGRNAAQHLGSLLVGSEEVRRV